MKTKPKKKTDHEARTMRPAIGWLKLPVIPKKLAQILIFLLLFANIGVYYLISSQASSYNVRFVHFCATNECSFNAGILEGYAAEVQSWYTSRVGKSFNRLPTVSVTGSYDAAYYSGGSRSNTDQTYYRVREDLAAKGYINAETKTVVMLGFRSMANCGVGSGVLAIYDSWDNDLCPKIPSAILAHELGHTLLSSSNADHLNDGTLMHVPASCGGSSLGSCALNGNQKNTIYNNSPWFNGGGGVPPPPPPPCTVPPAPAGSTDRLNVGQQMTVGQSLFASNGSYQLAMQGDGNLVIYNTCNGTPVWNPGLGGKGGVRAVLQSDGNFVVYNAGGGAVWASGTPNRGGAFIVLQTDGNLVIYTSSGGAVWSSRGGGGGGGGTPPPTGTRDRLNPGNELPVGQSLFASNGSYQLAMQTDGNLVIYNRGTGSAIWNPSLQGRGGVKAVFQGDGNFVVYTAGGGAVWASGSQGRGGAYIVLQTDGNLVIYTGSGTAIWASR